MTLVRHPIKRGAESLMVNTEANVVKKFDAEGLRMSILTMQRNISALEKQAHKSPKIANKLKTARKRLEKRMKLLQKTSAKPGLQPSPKLKERPRNIPIDESLKRNMEFSKRTGDTKSYDKKVDALMKELEKT